MDREGYSARYSVRIHFDNLVSLATAKRSVEFALAVGSIPPEMRHIWNRLEHTGVQIELFERGAQSSSEQGVDQSLQVQMLRKSLDYPADQCIAVLLTGDGKGFYDGVGFHADLERMQKIGWRIEVLSWSKCCNAHLKRWAEQAGLFIPLDNYYDSITFLEQIRSPKSLNLTHRPLSKP